MDLDVEDAEQKEVGIGDLEEKVEGQCEVMLIVKPCGHIPCQLCADQLSTHTSAD